MPVPLDGLNSPYDDFNSATMGPAVGNDEQGLVFSTNRGSKGHDFDLYASTITLRWTSDRWLEPPTTTAPRPFAPKLMSDGNERGPLAFDRGNGKITLVLASDRPGGQGRLDLYVADCNDHVAKGELPCEHASELHALTALNSAAADAYLSLPFANGQRLFASSRAGGAGMDIYVARWALGAPIEAPPLAIERVDALSSDADDTAPYVDEDDVVFASARPGGLGERDLYCSRFVHGAWIAPVNLGAAINSERDEYRAIIVRFNRRRFLIFSSTRDGGQGGYDLYIAAYPGCALAAITPRTPRTPRTPATPGGDM
jgi:hypothetical protein